MIGICFYRPTARIKKFRQQSSAYTALRAGRPRRKEQTGLTPLFWAGQYPRWSVHVNFAY